MTPEDQNELLGRLDERTEQLVTDVAEIKTAINGNGHDGLKTTTAVNRLWLKIAWAMIVLQMTGLLGMAWFILQESFKKGVAS